MIGEKAKANDRVKLSVGKIGGVSESANAQGHYEVECVGPDGKLKWNDTIENVVTNEGKNEALDQFLDGTAYTAAWYMGLQNGSAPTISSTYLTPICTEVTDYTEANRPTPDFSTAASSGSKQTVSAVAFSINATVDVDGVMLSNLNTKGNTAGGGVLYSAGDFTGGTKSVANGDTLNVTYTASL